MPVNRIFLPNMNQTNRIPKTNKKYTNQYYIFQNVTLYNIQYNV